MIQATTTRRRAASPVTTREVVQRRTFWVCEERAFPVELIARETARHAPLRSWRIVSDERRWLTRGTIELELTGTEGQIEAFQKRWNHTLFVYGWTEY